jgi:hypothetical protein
MKTDYWLESFWDAYGKLKPGEPAPELEFVDPHRLGWQRHPTRPRVWVADNGSLYFFRPNQTELLLRLKKTPLDKPEASD